jgi:hypothetical protein
VTFFGTTTDVLLAVEFIAVVDVVVIFAFELDVELVVFWVCK